MEKDELGGILLTLLLNCPILTDKTEDEFYNNMACAKSAILAWVVKQLPEKKEENRHFNDWEAGFNSCLDEIKGRMG